MSVESNGKVERPNHPLPRSYVEPILFLAHEMAKKDRVVPVPDQRMVDRLAKEIGIDAQQMRKWFHGMTDEQAIRKLDLELAKKGALVVLALILKADTTGGDQARKYFTHIRTQLELEPIKVPSDLEEHRRLAEDYLVD